MPRGVYNRKPKVEASETVEPFGNVAEPVKAPAPAPVEKSKAVEVRAKVICPNVWTSKGKALKMETVYLPKDEADWLESREQVVVLGE